MAVVGGGISGVTAAWQLARLGVRDFVLFEAGDRLGGTVRTVRQDGFVLELGPDGWVSEKPWARELAEDLGLGDELIGSNDAGRVTYLLQAGRLAAIPAGMRMMVPGDLAALDDSALFSAEAKRAYAAEPARAAELKAAAPAEDESIAEFVRRHFGDEVLAKVGAPLLSGVFGGDVAKLSVRAVMPQFVRLERDAGSLILGLQTAIARRAGKAAEPIFTSLRGGMETLVERMTAELPANCVRLQTAVTGLARTARGWMVETDGAAEQFDAVVMALPAAAAARLLRPVSAEAAELMQLEASSAVLVAFGFTEWFEVPRGFGFLVPAGERSALLAGTFVDQKFDGRVPRGGRVLRAFFGGTQAEAVAATSDEEIAGLALEELRSILGPLPDPAVARVNRLPQSLPQYGVGHLARVADFERLLGAFPGLHVIGNALHGVGLSDVVREARAAASALTQN